WNVLAHFRDSIDSVVLNPYEHLVMKALWARYFKGALDEMPGVSRVWEIVKKTIQQSEWYEALDLIETLVQYFDKIDHTLMRKCLAHVPKQMNSVFEQELVGYRFLRKEITPITAARDIEAIEDTLEELTPYSGAQQHLEQAIKSLSDRANPNYAQSISEAVKAVEGVVQKLTESKAPLGTGLNRLEKAGIEIHPGLKEALRTMYGWASNDKGIRHAASEASEVDQSLAKYMVIACSAFVSYLLEESSKNAPPPKN